ncbi:MAG: MBL fold metallo-hydrolase [Steroidobacteraceae bacterium]
MPALVSGQFDEIGPGVRRLVANNPGYMTGPGTNSYVIGHERFFVVDPGPQEQRHIDRLLEVTQGRIAAVLATHTHQDHSPGARALCERTGAALYGMRAAHAERQDPTFAPTRELRDNEVVNVDGLQVRALHTPGHASNHLCYLLPNGLLLTGDHLMQGSTVVITPPDGNMRAYLQSLERLQTEPVRALAPGHGAVIEDGQGEIAGVIAHRLKREAKVIAKLLEAGGAATTDDLVPPVYDDVDPRIHPVARYSLLAHLIKLCEDGKVVQQGEEPTRIWRWAGTNAGNPA